MASSSSQAPLAIAFGIAGILLPPISIVFTPALIFAVVGSLFAIFIGVTELQKVGRGDLDESVKPLAIVSLVIGGLGCLGQLAMGVFTGFAIFMFIVLLIFGG